MASAAAIEHRMAGRTTLPPHRRSRFRRYPPDVAIYEYVCLGCEHRFEQRRSIDAPVDVALTAVVRERPGSRRFSVFATGASTTSSATAAARPAPRPGAAAAAAEAACGRELRLRGRSSQRRRSSLQPDLLRRLHLDDLPVLEHEHHGAVRDGAQQVMHVEQQLPLLWRQSREPEYLDRDLPIRRVSPPSTIRKGTLTTRSRPRARPRLRSGRRPSGSAGRR